MSLIGVTISVEKPKSLRAIAENLVVTPYAFSVGNRDKSTNTNRKFVVCISQPSLNQRQGYRLL